MTALVSISDLVAWREQRIDFDPPEKFWGFNPSIMQTLDGRLLCAMRCANYHRTMGLRLPATIANRNFMLEIDPVTLRITRSTEMLDESGATLIPSRISGYDDLRLTWTHGDGLVALANSAHFGNGTRRDMVVLELDDRYQIAAVTPLLGSWASSHQKNWTPFVGTEDLRMTYSVERGGVHSWTGRLTEPCGPERYQLRGGTQLVRVAPHRWLGMAHGVDDRRRMRGESRRDYWHMWYLTDDDASIQHVSRPFKLTTKRIEFASGLAFDAASGRLVVSYGVEDDHGMFGVTNLHDVLAVMREPSQFTEHEAPMETNA